MKIRLYAYGHDGSIRDIKEVPSDARGGAKRQAVNGLPWRCEFPKPRIIKKEMLARPDVARVERQNHR